MNPALIIECPDCTGHAHLIWYEGWVADVVHDPACPALPPGDARRAAEDWITAQLARRTTVADYGDDVVAVHTAAA